MSNVKLGTVSADVRIEKSGLRSDVSEIKSLMAQMASNMETATERAERRATAAVEAHVKRRKAILKDYADSAGKYLTLAGGAMLAGLGGAVKVAADFEQAMSGVKAVSQATAEEMKQLSAQALKLGRDTKFSAVDAAKAQEELLKGGVKVKDVLGGALKGALSLAAAGEMDVAEAAKVAANAMTIFGLQGREMSHVADLLANAANKTTGNVSDFAAALQQAGAQAKLAGLSIDETVAALAIFAKNGVQGSDAGTSFKVFLQNLIPTSDKAAELMRKLNLHFFDSQGRMKSLTEIGGELKRGLAGLTDQQRQFALQTMFGSDGIRAATFLYKEGAAGIAKMERETAKKGEADRIAAEKQNNLKGAIDNFKESVKTLGVEIGTRFLPKLTAVTQWLTRLMNGFTSLPAPVKNTITNIALFGGGIAVATGVVIKLTSAVVTLKTNLTLLGLTGTATGARVAAGVGTAIAAMGRLAKSAAGTVAAGATMLLSPKRMGDGTLRDPTDPRKALGIQKARLADTRRYLADPTTPGADPNIDWKQTERIQAQQVRETYARIAAQEKQQALERKSVELEKEAARLDAAAKNAGRNPAAGFIDKMMAGGSGGGGGKRGGSSSAERAAKASERAVKQAARQDEQRQRYLESVKDAIFAASAGVTEFDVERRRITRQYEEDRRNNVPEPLAKERFEKERARVNERQRKEAQEDWKARQSRGLGSAILGMMPNLGGLQSGIEAEKARQAQGFALMGRALQGLAFAQENRQAEERQAQEREDAQREAEQKEQQSLDRRRDWEAQYNLISLAQYKTYLTRRLTSLEEYSEEWMTVQGKIFEIERQQEQQKETLFDKNMKRWKSVAGGLEGVFSNAFQNVLSGGKDFFSSLLDGFKQMLAQMLAQAMAAGILRSLFGGNFMTGFLGVFGFDDAHNDRIASRWGWDAARNFAVGARDYDRQRGVQMAGAGAGSQSVNITVNMGGVQMASGMDVESIGREIAWHVQQRLPVVRR
jgi:TP901 family phage tail tape measure protein